MPASRRLLPLLLLLLAVLLVFLNTLSFPFLWDYHLLIPGNGYMTSFRFIPRFFTENITAGAGQLSNIYRPLLLVTHFIDLRLWGFAPAGHHLTNVLLQMAAAAVIYGLLRRLVPAWPAALAAALFCLHPLQSFAVAYLCGRTDTLAILFIGFGLLSFRKNRRLCGLFALCAMLSKESAVMFPVFLLLYDFADGNPLPLRRHVPFWLMAGCYAAARLTFLNFQNTLNFSNQPGLLTAHPLYRITTYLPTLPKGLALWLWPVDLHHQRSWQIYPGFSAPVLAGALLLAGMVFLALVLWRNPRWRPAGAGLAWFLLATLPTSNLIVLINARFYDHWFLLPGLGLGLTAGCLIARAFEAAAWTRRTAAAGALILAVISAGATLHYNRVWRNPIALYTHILRWEPQSALVHANLAAAYARAGRPSDAIREGERAISRGDRSALVHHNLAGAYWALQQEERALEEVRLALEADPSFYVSHLLEGRIRISRREWEAAGRAFEAALRIHPYAVQGYLGLAEVRTAQGDPGSAIRILETGLKFLPGHPALQEGIIKMKGGNTHADAKRPG